MVAQRFDSDGIALEGELAEPTSSVPSRSTLVICHGYPSPSEGTAGAGLNLGELGRRIAQTMGWRAFTFRFRGCGDSQGNFSIGGWRSDVIAAVNHVKATCAVDDVWLAGFGTGGSLCLGAAAEIGATVRGVATMGAPAGFDEWASHTRRLLQHSRHLGVVRDEGFPESRDAWADEFKTVKPVDDAAKLSDRPMLVIHGADDEAVPVFDARVLADAHGTAELRILAGAGHGLRYDPRVVAILLGWLDRTENRVSAQG